LEKVKVSIIVPCRNEEGYIGQCVQSMVDQDYGIENIEVLVCDGDSEDKTREIVNKFTTKYSQIKLLNNSERVTPAGLNLGIESSTGEVIIIFGAHAYMEKNYVSLAVEKLYSADDIGCVGGRIINISENGVARAISLAMSSPFGVGNALFRFSNVEQFVDTVAFGTFRKSVFDEVGGFDRELVRNQDDELSFRIIKSGRKILLVPGIISHYYTRGSFSKLWRQYYQYGFWKVRVIQKHKKPASIRHLIPLLFVLSLILGTVLSLFVSPIKYLVVAELVAYLLCALVFSLKLSKSKISYIPLLIITFLILHLSYGIGFLEGIFVFLLFKSKRSVEKNIKSSR
jgi:cellulose synthase/poly-beta-1,6-N-acetylglucosamine synthase-like glycosyltransferase